MFTYDYSPAMNYQLPKSERLHAEKSIKELFNEGSSFFLFPFKVQFFVKKGVQAGTPQVLFSVSKRKLKKAVDRNFVKRRIKEAYRLNKHLVSLENIELNLGLVYVAGNLMEFSEIQAKIIPCLKKLQTLLSENHHQHE
jgi:ribonuclease P protein component